MRNLIALLITIVFFAFSAELVALRAQTILGGTTDGGAFYTFVVPDDWNGDLVIFNHGLSRDPVGPVGDLGPLSQLQLAQGYAIAASSYQQSGWALFKTKNDIMNMYEEFEALVGIPQNIFLIGVSLGALVSVELVEHSSLRNIVGVGLACGPLGGSRIFDQLLDLRLIYDAVCSGVPGALIPGGAKGLPEGSNLTEQTIDLAVNACTGILADPAERTDAQAERLDRILTETNIPENFLLTNMRNATLTMSDLVHTPGKLAGQIGVGNVTVTYDDPIIDDTIERVTANPGAAFRLRDHYTPSGAVGDAKIISIHTDKDGLVFVEHEKEYAEIVPPSHLTTAIVIEAVPSHCQFTGAEGVAVWQSLRAWVAGAPKPTAASIQTACLLAAPVFGGPCRYDPAFVVPDLDDRVPPR